MARKSSERFRSSNKNFVKYFVEKNRRHFVTELFNDQTARDYYLFFLHTASSERLGGNTVLVSASLSFDESFRHQKNNPDGCIIYYIVPEPLDRYAVSHLRMSTYVDILVKRALPTYKNLSLYPREEEVAIRGALFSRFILGIRTVSDNHFIVNPHIFSDENGVETIVSGLWIDQSDFDERLDATDLRCGVGTRLDGYFRTIERLDSGRAVNPRGEDK